MKKRIIAAAISLALCVSLMPSWVYARDYLPEEIEAETSLVEDVIDAENPVEEAQIEDTIEVEDVIDAENPVEEAQIEDAIEVEDFEASMAAGTVAASGKCGANVTYSVAQSGTDSYELVISGSGDMYDYDDESEEASKKVPWTAYRSQITSVKISGSVSRVGAYAFASCSKIRSISIPSSVKSIGEYAIWDCARLTNVALSEGLITIENGAFQCCPNLAEITIPASVVSVYSLAFYGCSNLERVVLLNNAVVFDFFVFDDCSSNLTLYGDAGSTAESYAKSNGLKFSSGVPTGLTITSQPENVTAGVNAQVAFSVAASGAVSYQWQYSKNNGEKWINSGAAGAKTESISVKVSASNAGNIYRCVVTGANGQQVTSVNVGVDLLSGAVIVKNPQSAAAALGEYATFTVEAENASTYQWQYSKDGAHWYNSGATGNTTDTLQVKAEQKSQGNRYRCVVTGPDGNKKKSLGCAMIVMKVAPGNCSAKMGEPVIFSLQAEGIVAYQWQYSKDQGETWYKSGAAGADSDTVTFTATAATATMRYRCKLTTEEGAYAFSNWVSVAM